MKKKKTGLLILLIILVLGLVGGVYYLLQSQQAPTPTPTPTPKTPSVSEVTGTNACSLEFDVVVPADIYCKAKQAWNDVSGNTAGNYIFTDPEGNKLPAGYEFTPGEVFVYSVIAANNSSTASTAVRVDDTLPDTIEYLDGDSNCTYTATTHSVSCEFPDGIAANAEERASFRVKVKDDATIGSFENTATVTEVGNRGAVGDSCSITLAVKEEGGLVCTMKTVWMANNPDLNLDNYSDLKGDQILEGDEVSEGDRLLYIVSYQNPNKVDGTVVDELSDNVEFIDSSQVGDSVSTYDAQTHTITQYPIQKVLYGSLVYLVEVKSGTEGEEILNTATVTNSSTSEESTCSIGIVVENNPKLSCVDKRIWENEVGNSAGSYTYQTQISGAVAGDTILYEIRYSSSNLNTITITDTLDTNLEYVDSDSECSYDSSTRLLTCTKDVSSSSDGSIFYRAKIADAAADGTVIANTAEVENTANSLTDSCSANVEVSKVVVVASPSPSASVSSSPTPTPSTTTTITSSPAPSALPEAGIMSFTVGSIGAGAVLMLIGLLGLLIL